jgi:hypothetical protein
MLTSLRRQWSRLPEGLRLRLVRTGLPYAASFMARYRQRHRLANFAGNLRALQSAYSASPAEQRQQLLDQFDSIVDMLVMPNAVTKTTYANRLAHSLSSVLAAIDLPNPEIRVLDLPASTGIASLQSLALLRERYRVSCYVLGDKYHRILYDARRRCVFDDQGNLLQVAFGRYYFSIYRGHVSGDEYTLLSSCLLFPHSIVGWYLRRRYRFEPRRDYQQLLVVHPEVEKLLDREVFRLQEMDVFEPIPGRYELILSFNLLQQNYFPAERIRAGVNNLAEALSEGGLLVMGNSESFLALQKRNGTMIPCAREGSF